MNPGQTLIRPESLALLGSFLRQRREFFGLTLDKLAAATGISKPYLSNIETARTPGPPSEPKLQRLAEALQIPASDLLAAADWLRTPPSIRQALSQEPAPRRPDGSINLDALMPPPQSSAPAAATAAAPAKRGRSRSSGDSRLPLASIPLINRVAAGTAAEFTDLGYPTGIADQYLPMPDLPDTPAATAFALRVLGDSMAPEYIEGELLIVGPGEPRDGDDCVVRLGERDNFATTFKRVYFEGAGDGRDGGDEAHVVLTPLNPAHKARRIALSQVTGIYPLIYRLIPAHHPRPAPNAPAREPEPPPRPQSFTTPLSLEND